MRGGDWFWKGLGVGVGELVGVFDYQRLVLDGWGQVP